MAYLVAVIGLQDLVFLWVVAGFDFGIRSQLVCDGPPTPHNASPFLCLAISCYGNVRCDIRLLICPLRLVLLVRLDVAGVRFETHLFSGLVTDLLCVGSFEKGHGLDCASQTRLRLPDLDRLDDVRTQAY